MGDTTTIEWTRGRDGKAGHTWNPWQGCHKVSAGCANCYMFAEKTRYGQRPDVVVRSKPATFNAPRKWRDPAFVFTCSWSDFFIEEADAWRDEAWGIIRATPHLTYQIVTKRTERISRCLPPDWGDGYRNAWLLATVENQPAADARIQELVSVPAVVHGLSMEPLLGPISLLQNMPSERMLRWYRPMLRELDWLIVGGESGPGARPCNVAWVRSVVKQCRAAGCPVFVKQLGANIEDRNDAGFDGHSPTCWPIHIEEEDRVEHLEEGYQGAPVRVHTRHRKGADMEEFPNDLRVREFPDGR